MNPSPSIVFMGTPDFAVPSLQALHKGPFKIRLVVTQPDRPKGRGRRLAPPPVKRAAQSMALEIAQPPKVHAPSFIEHLQSVAPDFLVVVAFGQILPASVLDLPTRCAVNVHASLLPKYRGPAPIHWALLRGEKETGVTTMIMDLGVDTGDILLTARTPIAPEDTTGSLHDRLARMGGELLPETLLGLWNGMLYPRAQRHAEATYAPALKKEDGRMNWHQPAEQLDAFVRGMTPWPGAFCFWNGRRLGILKVRAVPDAHSDAPPGIVLPAFADELRIAAGKGVVSIIEIQSPSGKRLAIKDFLHGHKMEPGTRLE